MLRLFATNRTNLPLRAPSSTDATVNVVVAGVLSVVAGAFADLVFVDVVMMTFLSVGTLFCLFFVFLLFSLGGLALHTTWGRKHNEKSVCC